ncbi:transposable element Tcb2 transposase [Trichonephila clavipes]|nr:transposable element Tcb2 transposase [Trichonephila clavipes]
MANNQSVRRRLDAFTRGRIIGKLEEGRSVTSVAAEFGIAHSIVSRIWRQFQITGIAIWRFSSGRPRETTPANDRYIVLQARKNRRQTAGEIARHMTQATGRPISCFTVTRRLHGGGLFARRPVRCVPLTLDHRRRRFLWYREHRNWRDNEWGRILFTDESRFSLSRNSHRILIWRERGSCNHLLNIIERDRYGGRGVLVWGGIMLGSRTDLHIFDAGSVNGTRYCNEILLPYVRLFRGALGLQFLFMDDNAPCHRTVAPEQLLESRRFAARTLPPVTIRELRLALQDEWAAMPLQLIDTLILSRGRRCETCLAKKLLFIVVPLVQFNFKVVLLRKQDWKTSRNVTYRSPWLGVLSRDWNLGKHKELYRMLLERQKISLQNCGINSKKQGMFDVGQDRVVHRLPHQIMNQYIL